MAKLIHLLIQEFKYRWVSGLLVVLVVAAVAGALTFFCVNRGGMEKEIIRNSRDIGSNVVVLPAQADQVAYHLAGGYSEDTMPQAVLDQLIEYRASMNHLIPMLERKSKITMDGSSCEARVVGLTASVPMPGRPKSPMQRAVDAGKVQLGSQVAAKLGIERDAKPTVSVAGKEYGVQRVNRETGTWQDGAVFMELAEAQSLFELEGQVSRIEAIECTSEKCALTGLLPETVLRNELAGITDQAQIMRRESIADARQSIRTVTGRNTQLLELILWTMVLIAVGALTGLNAQQRQSEIGVLRALGHSRTHVLVLFVGRSFILATIGATIGMLIGAAFAMQLSRGLFVETGAKFAVNWWEATEVVAVTVCLSALAACVPSLWAAAQHPADVIGKSR